MYLEDRRQAIQVATNTKITISYNPKTHERNYRHKTKHSKLVTSNVPVGKRAVGLHVSMEFFDDDSEETTTWYKGTVISYSRREYVVTFDGFEKAIDMGKLKMLT